MKFQVNVVELREVECVYIVEAPNLKLAREHAHVGNTISAHTIGTISVVDREIEDIAPLSITKSGATGTSIFVTFAPDD